MKKLLAIAVAACRASAGVGRWLARLPPRPATECCRREECRGVAEEQLDPGLRTYFGVFASGGTPRPIVDRLNAEWNKALQTPKIQEFLRAQTLDYVGGTAQEFAEFLKVDRANAGRVFKALGVTPTDAP